MYFLRETLFKCKICVLIAKSVELLQDHHFSTLPDSLSACWLAGVQALKAQTDRRSCGLQFKSGNREDATKLVMGK